MLYGQNTDGRHKRRKVYGLRVLVSRIDKAPFIPELTSQVQMVAVFQMIRSVTAAIVNLPQLSMS